MNDYTPTLDEVRRVYAEHAYRVGVGKGALHGFSAEAELDRFLAEHDRQVKAEAWAEGAQWAAVEAGFIENERQAWSTADDNPYLNGDNK